MQQTTASSASNQEQHLRAQIELLQNHETDPSSTSAVSSHETRSAPSQPESRTANGYDALAAASHDAARALTGKTEAESHIHPDLRAPLNHGHGHHVPHPNMMSMAPPSAHSPGAAPGGPQGQSLAPAPPSPIADDDGSGEGRKAKRELSQSKRAAQNRAAQRAFRQRKEGYIKKLEQQVREYADMEQSFKSMQSENYALREYIIHLQSRLVDTQGDFPPPPPNVNLSQAHGAPEPPVSAPEPTHGNPGVGTPLEAVAQAVAGLQAQEQLAERHQPYATSPFKNERGDEDMRTADEINRQLQTDEGAGQPPGV